MASLTQWVLTHKDIFIAEPNGMGGNRLEETT